MTMAQVQVAASWLTAISETNKQYFCDTQKLCKQHMEMLSLPISKGSKTGRTIKFRLKFGTFLFQFREYIAPSVEPSAKKRHLSKKILRMSLTFTSYLGKEFEFKEEDYISWSSMGQLCSDIGGQLPVFYSKSELNELLSLLTVCPDLPVLEAIYIGLYVDIFSRVGDKQ